MRMVIGLAVSTLLAAVLGYSIGPEVVVWFFGSGRALGATETALIAAGLVMATVGVLVTLALMAKRANRIAVVSWAASVILALLLAGYGVSIPVAFFTGEAMAIVLTVASLWYLLARAQASSSPTE